MKKLILLLTLTLCLCGCSSNSTTSNTTDDSSNETTVESLPYIFSIGPDITKVEYTNIVYNIYHTVEGKWTLLHTFTTCPEEGNYVDVILDMVNDDPDSITFILEETSNYDEEEGTCDQIDLEEYTYELTGNTEENTYGSYTSNLNNSHDEQIYKVYTIGENVYSLDDKTLDDLYDEDGTNLDNFLITLTIED